MSQQIRAASAVTNELLSAVNCMHCNAVYVLSVGDVFIQLKLTGILIFLLDNVDEYGASS